MLHVKAQIVRWVDDYQPGIVECAFTDRLGREWRFVEKLPIVSLADDLDGNSVYPQLCMIACVVIARGRDELDRDIVEVDTEQPWDIRSTDDVTRFHVCADQLIDIP